VFGLQLLRIAEHARHARQTGPGLRLHLHRAAGNDDLVPGVLPMHPADRLPGLALGLRRHGTSIHHDRLGQRRGMPADHLGLVRVQATAECEDLHRHAE
jgi:hypothetical protein